MNITKSAMAETAAPRQAASLDMAQSLAAARQSWREARAWAVGAARPLPSAAPGGMTC